MDKGVDAAIRAGCFGASAMSSALELHPEALDAISESVSAALSAKVRGSKVSITDTMPFVRVRLSYSDRGSRRTMTVIAGMDVLSQVVMPFLEASAVRPAAQHAMASLRDALREEEVALSLAVQAAADDVLSDPKVVREVREEMAGRKAKKRAVERTNFVSQVASLLASGWTLDDLMSSVNEAVVANVLHS